MGPLIGINIAIIVLSVGALFLCKKKIQSEKGKNVLFLAAAVLTIACHYSSLLYHVIKEGSAMGFLRGNPNLLLPIYPCNVVMWCCLIFSLLKKKNARLGSFLADYIFWFGIVSALVGMFANVDFIREPSLANYDVTKGIVAHGFMLFNILLFPAFGFVKIDLPKNYLHILLSMVMMFFIGCYCNLVFEILSGSEMAYQVNSMFILHSPFDGMPFLRYGLICVAAAAAYFGVFSVAERIAYKKGERWTSRYQKERI